MKCFPLLLSSEEMDDLSAALSFFLVNYIGSNKMKASITAISEKIWKLIREEAAR